MNSPYVILCPCRGGAISNRSTTNPLSTNCISRDRNAARNRSYGSPGNGSSVTAPQKMKDRRLLDFADSPAANRCYFLNKQIDVESKRRERCKKRTSPSRWYCRAFLLSVPLLGAWFGCGHGR
jgi:hypothetical protein